jgi:hypothetical protein
MDLSTEEGLFYDVEWINHDGSGEFYGSMFSNVPDLLGFRLTVVILILLNIRNVPAVFR